MDETVEATKRMVVDPDTWPNWPVLPVKRRGRTFDEDGMGVLLDTVEDKGKIVVHHVNMFMLKMLPDAKTTVFADVEGFLDAGWVVD